MDATANAILYAAVESAETGRPADFARCLQLFLVDNAGALVDGLDVRHRVDRGLWALAEGADKERLVLLLQLAGVESHHARRLVF